jgi:hypothetical protein
MIHLQTLEERSPFSRLLAFVLAFFFGFWGVHRFYTGRILTGLLWFFTGGLLGFGWFFDLILIAIGRFKDGQGRILGEPVYSSRPMIAAQPMRRETEQDEWGSAKEFDFGEVDRDPLLDKFAELEKQEMGR